MTGEFAAAETAELRGVYAAVIETIEAMPDRRAAFRAATDLAELAGTWTEEAASLRATIALQIAENDKLSLGELAGRISVSRARAAQLVNRGKATRTGKD
jgi:hypothetical protein